MARSNKTKSRIRGQKAPPKSHVGNKFTMQQEARNTEGRNLWRAGSQLRYKSVKFVSAGDMRLEEENTTDPPKMGEAPGRTTPPPEATASPPRDQLSHTPTKDTPLSVDMLGEGIASADISDPAPEQIFTDDGSSEDEIVFLGRQRRTGRSDSPPPNFSTSNTEKSRPQPETSTQKMAQHMTPLETTQTIMSPRESRQNTTYLKLKKSSTEDTGYISLTNLPRHRSDCDDRWDDNDDDDGFLADYIANMDNDYLDLSSSSSSSEDIEEQANARETAKAASMPPERNETDPENTHLVGVLPTEVTAEIQGAEQKIGSVDCERGLQRQDTRAPEATLSDFITSNASDTEPEECGTDEECGSETIETIIRELEESNSRLQRTHNRHKGRLFAPATAFADALESDPYYGFDVMDFGRPSLRTKKRGKHRALDLVLSDSDLEMELEKAWKNDREKKTNKKREREYLRSQGLLGRDSNDPDLRSKYSSGSMGFDDLNEEICRFLLSSKKSLPLPPMAKQRRKVVHDLAHDLGLNSQSRGKGSARFTILHKTSRTPKYTQKTIGQADRIFSKGKFKYGGSKMWDQHVKKSAKVRQGRPDGNVSYMDGDIVGASAPEIGAGNKGRAMLEKMGWSTGTALGAANNKGILLPVAQVVKNSKAGLG